MAVRTVLAALLLIGATTDLDVGVPPGSPLDFVRMPGPGDAGEKKEPGRTVIDDNRPQRFMPLNRTLTRDFAGHLKWPKGLPTEGTPTKAVGKKMEGYPPEIRNDLYMHCVAMFLMVLLHPSQVSEREVASYLLDIGEPAAYAAAASKSEPRLKELSRYVRDAVGAIPAAAPAFKTSTRVEDEIARELVTAFPYDQVYAPLLLGLPEKVTLPILARFVEDPNHRLLRRNATFALRAVHDPAAVPILRRLVKSDDKVMRNRALAALIRWRDTEIVPWLIEQLTGPDVVFRNYALHALGKIGDRRAVLPIVEAVRKREDDAEFLWSALPALARLRDGRKEVLELLESLEEEIVETPDLWPSHRPDRPDSSGTRRRILEERLKLAAAAVQGKKPRGRLAGKWLHPVNRLLGKELTGPPPPPPGVKAPEPPKPETAGKESPPDPAETVLARHGARIHLHNGVRSVEAEDGRIRIVVETLEDAEDLRVLLGPELKGVPLVIRVRK